MENNNYRGRVCDEVLRAKLRGSGAVLVTGPKWCGKTWTSLNAAASVIYLQDPDRRASYLKMAQTQPSLLLRGEKPLLIDEWQDVPVLWDAVRFAVDTSPGSGQFILTGSVVERKDWIDDSDRPRHSGVGRIAQMRMRPMSLFESGESNGTVSLRALFDGVATVDGISSLTIEQLAFAICRGGWPATLSLERADALAVVGEYVDILCRKDIIEVDGSRRDPDRARSILRSLARNVSTMTTDKTIMDDVCANDISLTDKTLASYLGAFNSLFVTENVCAWQPSLRSRTAIRTSEKRQFVDPSIAVAAVEASPDKILDDFNYFGFLFESLCVRDIRVYAEPLRGTVRHYHDKNELEADIIITLNDGRWAAVEVKLGSGEIDEGATHLLALADRINPSRLPPPSFLMVLTGGEFAYRRADGVYVVPIGCLKN
ncbi:MAG: ATP-binding protein [Bacteroidaceae bacterium]|nr:ATP-binding protein [Bacteroidaceae bacterium]